MGTPLHRSTDPDLTLDLTLAMTHDSASALAHVLNLQVRVGGVERLDERLARAQKLINLSVDHLVALLVAEARGYGECEVRVAGSVRDGEGEGLP